ncbi:unnamed protein product [Phaedon cochleariae]|uniref:CHK kinase-like domain-containing protein n=1 Tax=Phaedon cochleariae TaxID=80249 RepID=A0A9P0DCB3_PHACE|nr:unnamed protein product [Phaedon cochleariae]
MAPNELSSWIQKSLNDRYFGEKEIKFENSNGKTGGYLGSLLFGKIRGNNPDGESEDVDIVVKYGKKDDKEFLRIAFHREAMVYEKIVPLFMDLQRKKGIQMPFDSVPKCYQTIENQNLEAIILEDMRKSGYRLHNRTIPMDLPHLKLILENYAKWHALSFAVRDQNNGELESNKLTNVARYYFRKDSTRKLLVKYTKYAHQILLEKNEHFLADTLERILQKGVADTILEVLNSDVDECVITHGDGWNNNFLFKYEENNSNIPTKLAIIDWQLASLHSPALDLSLLIYTSSSKTELSHFEELLKFYHSTLTSFLKELGSNAEDIFSFSQLKEHWYRYSVFGFLWSLTFLRVVLSEDDGSPEEDMFDLIIKNKSDFDERLIALVKHHFLFRFT